jgi:hypothetical protein
VGYFDPQHLRDPAERERHEHLRLLLLVAEAQLRQGATVDVAALTRVAQDESLPARARRRAACVLARLVAP